MRETDALVDLYVDGEVISTTGDYPFWVTDKGWVEAADLVVGSLLQTEDGRIVDVDKIEKREGKFPVYNFNVEGFHTYFVSDLGILVHNTYIPPYRSTRELGSNVMFEWSPVGEVSIPPSVTVGRGKTGELILDAINNRGFPDGQGAGSEMIKQAAEGIGLSRPSKIRVPHIVNNDTLNALEAGFSPDDTLIGRLLKKTVSQLGRTPSNVRRVTTPPDHIGMEVDITY